MARYEIPVITVIYNNRSYNETRERAFAEGGRQAQTGKVVGWIDLTGLLPAADRAGVDVLNGIAYDAAHDRLFVTGKLWPRVFEIKVR